MLADLLRLRAGNIAVLARNEERRDVAAAADPARVRAVIGDPLRAPLPENMGFCIAAFSPVQLPDLYEEILYDAIHPVLASGGIVCVPLVQGAQAPAAPEALPTFLKNQFGEASVTAEYLRQRFGADGYFDYIDSTLGADAPGKSAIAWIALRKREAGIARAFPRTPRAERFPLKDFARLIAQLAATGTEFPPIDEFALWLGGAAGLGPSFGLVKLDIHQNIRRAPELGTILAKAGARGLFLMMHRHPLNADFYDAPQTWEILRALERQGHEIGLHLDPFHLIRTHGDLDTGIRLALADLRGRGLAVRAATLHGDTSAHLRQRRLFAHDFFREMKFRSTWDGVAPEGEPQIADHIARYSMEAIARVHGLVYFAEGFFTAKGNVVSPEPLPYLSDNRRSMALLNIPQTDEIADDTPFRIGEDFGVCAAKALRGHPFLALFHPQWFW